MSNRNATMRAVLILAVATAIYVLFPRPSALRDELVNALPGVKCDDAQFSVISDDAFYGDRVIRIEDDVCVRSISAKLAEFDKNLPGFDRDGVIPDGKLYRTSFSVDPNGQTATWYRRGK
jgi:hypothetical protein